MLLIVTIFVIIFGAIVLVFAIVQHQLAERRVLLHALAVAAEAKVPLHEVALAISRESRLPVNWRARKLAMLLSKGLALPDALRHSHPGLPDEIRVAVTTGWQMGSLSTPLSESIHQQDETQALLRPVLMQILYLVLLVWVTISIVASLMIFIVPIFKEMFDEFGLDLPIVSVTVIALADYGARFWWLLAPFVVVGTICTAVIGLAAFGLNLSFLPIFGRLSYTEDRAAMLRAIAMGLRSGWPVQKTLNLVYNVVANAIIRKRLSRVISAIDAGVSWSDAMYQNRLLRPREAAVVEAAAKAGNVAWALRELAEAMVRKKLLRTRAVVHTLMPIAMLVVGTLIGFIVVGLFAPLATMILELA